MILAEVCKLKYSIKKLGGGGRGESRHSAWSSLLVFKVFYNRRYFLNFRRYLKN
jgi:hypothetical protein